MHLVHIEYMVRGSEHDLILFGQYDRLQDVHRLREVGHVDPVTVAVEYVERDSRYESITQGVLLVEEVRVSSRLDIMPRTPFIDYQAHPLLRVVAVHDLCV